MELRKLQSTILNQNGFSLPELMVTSAIGVIVALGISTVFIFSITQFQLMMEKSQTEENALLLSFYSRVFISQAVDLRPAVRVSSTVNGAGIGPGTAGTTNGFLDYNFDISRHFTNNAVATANGNDDVIAVFNREWGTDESTPLAAAIFMRNRNTSGGSLQPEDLSYQVAFDLIAAGGLTYGPGLIKFDRVTRYEVQKIPLGGGYDAESATPDPTSYCLAMEVEPRPTFTVQSKNDAMSALPGHCLPPPGHPSFDAAGIFADTNLIVPANGYKIKTVTIHLATRHFRTITRTNWDYGRTTASLPKRDIEMTVKIAIKNNVLTTESLTSGTSRPERVHGGLYFFKPMFPKF